MGGEARRGMKNRLLEIENVKHHRITLSSHFYLSFGYVSIDICDLEEV